MLQRKSPKQPQDHRCVHCGQPANQHRYKGRLIKSCVYCGFVEIMRRQAVRS